jgi:hypothetical protein
MEGEGGQVAVIAGGFEDDGRSGSLVLGTPGKELFEAVFGVIELGLLWAGSTEETGVQRVFGDIQTQAGKRRRRSVQEQGKKRLLRMEVEVIPRRGELRSSTGLSTVYHPNKVDLDTIRLRPERWRARGQSTVRACCLKLGTVYPSPLPQMGTWKKILTSARDKLGSSTPVGRARRARRHPWE